MGKRLGSGSDFPWQSSDELFETLLDPSGVTLEQVKQTPGGVFFLKMGKKRYLKDGFKTPSGKVEFLPQIMTEAGCDLLPSADLTAANPAPQAGEYPLLMISGPRVIAFTHSRFRNIDRLRKLQPEPLAEIHPEAASEAGINEGDAVLIESPRGSLKMKARLTNDINPDVVSIPHGWDEANANLLTDDIALDPVSAYPPYKAARCRISRAPDDK